MKNISKQTIVLSALLSVATTIFVGCAALRGEDPTTLTRIGNVAFSVAQLGTSITLKSDPDSRPKLEAARDALSAMVAANRSDASELYDILRNSGITKWSADNGSMELDLVLGGLFIYEIGSELFWKPESKEAVTYIASRLRDGMNATLVPPTMIMSKDTRRAYPIRTKLNTRTF